MYSFHIPELLPFLANKEPQELLHKKYDLIGIAPDLFSIKTLKRLEAVK